MPGRLSEFGLEVVTKTYGMNQRGRGEVISIWPSLGLGGGGMKHNILGCREGHRSRSAGQIGGKTLIDPRIGDEMVEGSKSSDRGHLSK